MEGATQAGVPRPNRSDALSTIAAPELRPILEPGAHAAREAAWDEFVARYSRLFLHMARQVMPDRDGIMDAYAYLLEQLRRDDFKALRAYATDPRSRFSTWLAVVARRTCVDFFRQRYGRPRGAGTARHVQSVRAARYNLIRLPSLAAELGLLVDTTSESPDRRLRSAELYQALDTARAALSVEDRLLLQLRFDEDLSASAIASILGLPTPFHVYRRLKLVCNELRRRLTARGIEESTP
ncbi:MAG TPA: sigma-70 family RNA polymerase sigma factor [Gemmatimonadaceae bacterium]|nr:sigma-70 family RNA polymerase sigma factor [Gemmatimonadaceae bacterium]